MKPPLRLANRPPGPTIHGSPAAWVPPNPKPAVAPGLRILAHRAGESHDESQNSSLNRYRTGSETATCTRERQWVSSLPRNHGASGASSPTGPTPVAVCPAAAAGQRPRGRNGIPLHGRILPRGNSRSSPFRGPRPSRPGIPSRINDVIHGPQRRTVGPSTPIDPGRRESDPTATFRVAQPLLFSFATHPPRRFDMSRTEPERSP